MTVRKHYLGSAAPVDTVVEVARFLNPEWLIEVEADAVVAENKNGADDAGDGMGDRFGRAGFAGR